MPIQFRMILRNKTVSDPYPALMFMPLEPPFERKSSLRSFSANAAEEARLWSFKRDQLSGDVLPVLLPKHDHCWDAVRYALEPIIQAHARHVPRRPDREPMQDEILHAVL